MPAPEHRPIDPAKLKKGDVVKFNLIGTVISNNTGYGPKKIHVAAVGAWPQSIGVEGLDLIKTGEAAGQFTATEEITQTDMLKFMAAHCIGHIVEADYVKDDGEPRNIKGLFLGAGDDEHRGRFGIMEVVPNPDPTGKPIYQHRLINNRSIWRVVANGVEYLDRNRKKPKTKDAASKPATTTTTTKSKAKAKAST
jgi:hypothetical protein